MWGGLGCQSNKHKNGCGNGGSGVFSKNHIKSRDWTYGLITTPSGLQHNMNMMDQLDKSYLQWYQQLGSQSSEKTQI
jgi:hypothetical protein